MHANIFSNELRFVLGDVLISINWRLYKRLGDAYNQQYLSAAGYGVPAQVVDRFIAFRTDIDVWRTSLYRAACSLCCVAYMCGTCVFLISAYFGFQSNQTYLGNYSVVDFSIIRNCQLLKILSNEQYGSQFCSDAGGFCSWYSLT